MNCTEHSHSYFERLRPLKFQTKGWPSIKWDEFAIKDIINIVDLHCETPTTRQEKVSLQRRNRAINGFAIDKGVEWKLFAVQWKHSFQSASETDSGFRVRKDQRKHFAEGYTGAVCVRLLVEDDSDAVDSGIQINIVMQRASS